MTYKLISSMSRVIAHLDLDCFFVSCERIRNPKLIGKPVVVGGNAASRGVVASASYEARAFGVRSAMPAAQAKRLCPLGIFVPPDHRFYSKISTQTAGFLEHISPVLEQASIDEFYMDLSGCGRIYPDWIQFGRFVKECLKNEFHLPSSIAIASNKLVAKIAANEAKPDGLVCINSGAEADFLAPLRIQAMPGIGKATEREMVKLNLKTLGDIGCQSVSFLTRHFGKWGSELKARALGMDDTPVIPYEDPKSISRETTFEHDAGDPEYLLSVLSGFAEECAAELREYGFKARHVTVKFRLPDFRTFERSRTIAPTHQEKEIFKAAEQLFFSHWQKGMQLRLIGLGTSGFLNFQDARELFLNEETEKDGRISARLDSIRAKYGFEAIQRGSSLLHTKEPLQ